MADILTINKYRKKFPELSADIPDDNELAWRLYESELDKGTILPENTSFDDFKDKFIPSSSKPKNDKWWLEPSTVAEGVADWYKTHAGTIEGFHKAFNTTKRHFDDITAYIPKKELTKTGLIDEDLYELEREAYRENNNLASANLYGLGNEELLSVKGNPRASVALARKYIKEGKYQGTLRDFLNDPEGIQTSGEYTTLFTDPIKSLKGEKVPKKISLEALPQYFKEAILSNLLEPNETEISNFDVELVRPKAKSNQIKRIMGGDLSPFIASFAIGTGGWNSIVTGLASNKYIKAPQILKSLDSWLTHKTTISIRDPVPKQIAKKIGETFIKGAKQFPRITAGGEFAQQTLLNPYEYNLASYTAQRAANGDEGFMQDVLEFLTVEKLAVEKGDSELEARLKMALENVTLFGYFVGAEAAVKSSGQLAILSLYGIKKAGDATIKQFYKLLGKEYDARAKSLLDDAGNLTKDQQHDVALIMNKNPAVRWAFNKILLPTFRQGAQSKRMAEARRLGETEVSGQITRMEMTLHHLTGNVRNLAKWGKVHGEKLKEPLKVPKGVRGTFKWEEKEITTTTQVMDLIQILLTSDYRTFGIKTTKGFKAPITQTAGFNDALKILPEEIGNSVRLARQQIDDLSMQILDSKLINPEIKRIIQDNVGLYLTRSYRYFTNANWSPSVEVQENFIKWLSSPKRGNGSALYTEPQARTLVNEMLEQRRVLKQEGLDEGFGKQVKLLNKLNNSIFKERQNLQPELKAFLGEIEHPIENLQITIGKMAHWVELDKYLKTIKHVGEDVYFLTKKQVDQLNALDPEKGKLFSARLGGVDVQKQRNFLNDEPIPLYGALEGYYTTPELKKIISLTAGYKRRWYEKQEGMGKVMTAWAGIKSLGNMNATVLNNITHERNFLSGPIFLAGNGAFPDGKSINTALKSIMNDLGKMGIKELDEYTISLIKHGLGRSSLEAGIMGSVFKRFKDPITGSRTAERVNQAIYNSHLGRVLAENTKNSIVSPIKWVKFAKDLYVAEDTLFKAIYWEHTKKQLRQAYPKMAQEMIDYKAADIVKNTMPNYTMLSPVLKSMTYFPTGSFFAFRAEEIRTTFNMYAHGLREIADPNPLIRTMGAKRIAGATAVTGPLSVSGTIINEISKAHNGIGDDIELALNELQPDYIKYGQFVYRTGENGEIYASNLAFNDPYYDMHQFMIAEAYKAATAQITEKEYSQNMSKRLADEAFRILNPFYAKTISYEAIENAFLTGQDKYGRDIWRFADDYVDEKYSPALLHGNNLARSFQVILEDIVTPKILTNAMRIQNAKEYKYDEMQFKYDLFSEIVANTLGTRFVLQDPPEMFKRRIRQLNGTSRANDKYFREDTGEEGLTSQDLFKHYEGYLQKEYTIQREMAMATDSMFTLGYNEEEIDNLLKKVGTSNKIRTTLINNNGLTFNSIAGSDSKIKNIIKNNPKFRQYSPTLREYPRLNTEISQKLEILEGKYVGKTFIKLPHNDPERIKKYEDDVLSIYSLPEFWQDFKREQQKEVKKGKIVK